MWLIWLLLWFVAALPLGKLITSKRNRNFGFVVGKFIAIMALGLLFIVSMTNDSLMTMIWLFFLACSLACDFITSEGGYSTFLSVLLVGVAIVIVVAMVFAGIMAGNNNAIYFDGFITKSDGFPIEKEVPDNMLRVTTQDLAESISSQHMGEFGSAVKIVNSHVGVVDKRLYWLTSTANQESWKTTYRTVGMVAIDANDPDKPIEVIKQKFSVSEGLDFNPIIGANGASDAKGYYGIDSGLVYGDAYPVISPENKWYIALTAFRPDLGYVRKYAGVYQIDEHGEVIEHYQDNVPKWMLKPFDEDGFLEAGIRDWGEHKRGDGFDWLAGGLLWVAPSNDRLQITEDTRYVYDPDTDQVVAMVMVNPIREKGELSLAGAFKATSDGITYYDLRKYDLMSGVAASGVVKSKITARSGSSYYTAMELLYPVKVNNQTKYVWFVPIYYKSESSKLIGLAGLGIVDAQSADKVVVEYTGEGVTGESLIKKAKESFRNLYESNGQSNQLSSGSFNATFVSKYDFYTKEGSARGWIVVGTTNGNRELLIRSDLLTDSSMLKIQKIKPGDILEIEIDENNVVKKIK